jgi:hypothetical protein
LAPPRESTKVFTFRDSGAPSPIKWRDVRDRKQVLLRIVREFFVRIRMRRKGRGRNEQMKYRLATHCSKPAAARLLSAGRWSPPDHCRARAVAHPSGKTDQGVHMIPSVNAGTSVSAAFEFAVLKATTPTAPLPTCGAAIVRRPDEAADRSWLSLTRGTSGQQSAPQ